MSAMEEGSSLSVKMTHGMEYYSASQRKETVTRATTRINFEDNVRSEISQ